MKYSSVIITIFCNIVVCVSSLQLDHFVSRFDFEDGRVVNKTVGVTVKGNEQGGKTIEYTIKTSTVENSDIPIHTLLANVFHSTSVTSNGETRQIHKGTISNDVYSGIGQPTAYGSQIHEGNSVLQPQMHESTGAPEAPYFAPPHAAMQQGQSYAGMQQGQSYAGMQPHMQFGFPSSQHNPSSYPATPLHQGGSEIMQGMQTQMPSQAGFPTGYNLQNNNQPAYPQAHQGGAAQMANLQKRGNDDFLKFVNTGQNYPSYYNPNNGAVPSEEKYPWNGAQQPYETTHPTSNPYAAQNPIPGHPSQYVHHPNGIQHPSAYPTQPSSNSYGAQTHISGQHSHRGPYPSGAQYPKSEYPIQPSSNPYGVQPQISGHYSHPASYPSGAQYPISGPLSQSQSYSIGGPQPPSSFHRDVAVQTMEEGDDIVHVVRVKRGANASEHINGIMKQMIGNQNNIIQNGSQNHQPGIHFPPPTQTTGKFPHQAAPFTLAEHYPSRF